MNPGGWASGLLKLMSRALDVLAYGIEAENGVACIHSPLPLLGFFLSLPPSFFSSFYLVVTG